MAALVARPRAIFAVVEPKETNCPYKRQWTARAVPNQRPTGGSEPSSAMVGTALVATQRGF
jgi:hypothetical protein